MTEERAHAFGEVQGILSVLAWVNTMTNHDCTYEIDGIPDDPDPHTALVRYFGELARSVTLVPLENWSDELDTVLKSWIFRVRELLSKRGVSAAALADPDAQQQIIDQLLSGLRTAIDPREAWQVRIDAQGFYECVWFDMALRGPQGFFLLHLGVSD